MEHPVLASRVVSGNPSIRLQQHVQKHPATAIPPDPDFLLCILMAGMAIKSACPSSAAARDGLCLQNGVVLICHLMPPIVNMLHSYAFIALLPSFPFPIIWKIPFPAFEFKHHDTSQQTFSLPAASHAIAWTTTSAIPWELCKKPNNPFN